ncbi:MAG TPA: class II aldolase/adducin family protein [Frankiaceae bacterium]|nr:class II aldolase/adducin family protein [Frankiaceae bacterium]
MSISTHAPAAASATAAAVSGVPAVDQPRAGGTAVWAPKITPPIGHDLTPEQELACAFRILARGGFSEDIAGHITVVRDDGSLMINPWGLWWDEMAASDVCRVDYDGNVLGGKWDVTPAFHIHTELHRRRPDARVVVHNHPYHVVVLAAIGMLPEIVHQQGSMFDDDLVLVEEYSGEVDDAQLGAELAERIGSASNAILVSHGIIVTAPTIAEATYRSASIDRMCKLAYDVMLSGRSPIPLAKGLREGMKKSLIERGTEVFWNGAVRQLLRAEPDVLN